MRQALNFSAECGDRPIAPYRVQIRDVLDISPVDWTRLVPAVGGGYIPTMIFRIASKRDTGTPRARICRQISSRCGSQSGSRPSIQRGFDNPPALRVAPV